MRNRRSLSIRLSILGTCATLLVLGPDLLGAVSANQPSRLPPLLVKDNAGEVVGAVVAFEGFRPLVLLRDGAKHVLLRVERENLGGQHRVFYTDNNCTGTAYLPTFDASASLNASGTFDEMQQTVYGVGKPNGASTLGVLLKGSPAGTEPATTNSEWISTNPSAIRCFVATRTNVLRFTTSVVQDLDALFDTPLTVE